MRWDKLLGILEKTMLGNFEIKIEIMSNLLYIVAVVLVILWAIGFIGYQLGGIIHILLAIAAVAILLRLIKGDKIL